MFSEFRKFVMRGSVIDLAVGVIIGASFGKIVSSLVDDILMPPIGKLIGGVDFSNLFVDLNGGTWPNLATAKAAGAPTVNYGLFLNNFVHFLIVAFAVFLVVRAVNRLPALAAEPEVAPPTKKCPQCAMDVPLEAKRCGHCTSGF